MSRKVKENKSRYREIEVWVDPKVIDLMIDGDERTAIICSDDGLRDTVKATLLVPVEEKKVTISEGEFDEVASLHFSHHELHLLSKLKEKLFQDAQKLAGGK